MGNSPSANPKSPSSSSNNTPANSEPPRIVISRRDPRSFIFAPRAPAEPSLTPAHGTGTPHRTRSSSYASSTHINQSIGSSSPIVHDQPKDAPIELKQEPMLDGVSEEPSKPVDVPVPTTSMDDNNIQDITEINEPSEMAAAQDMSYHLTRPPRLPLPIEEEVHTPGSPLIPPSDLETPILDTESIETETLPHHTSTLSNSTIDDEDADELRVDETKATVPTLFEWAYGGEKIYVTGTIFHWNKKHCLHPVPGCPGIFRAVINVRPGTHHIRFIKDSVMLCSPGLPTTVDFGNNLVNYIEVSADDLPEDEMTSIPTNSLQESEVKNQAASKQPKESHSEKSVSLIRSRPVIPQSRYTSHIPDYIIDLDKPEDSPEYRNAVAAMEKLPTPPSLPGFLGKPILNAATPLKDDNSVLVMPNHSVLNHLATSSIKGNVLAVSVTTRYKRKYVTTILYKPTKDE
ncbi:SNF1 protein kinase subunit beta-3 [Erysiphe neolycopersici]|uniref:SNF1 protein kinase subunit beta-3 n=1 Tax=Erysiphe neolycopersici TaxID=212602 RepID=A0A420HZ65_9PEZI|nr:SNF1 protein kinase subunit beta-3 [Erysiphe neolycopersici]